MCVAQLGIVKKPGEKKALVDFSGIEIEVRSGLVDVKEGDNVLVHAGIIIQKLSEKEAAEMREAEELLK